MDERVTIKIPPKVRNRLRRYKAQDGQNYGEAIDGLLNKSGADV